MKNKKILIKTIILILLLTLLSYTKVNAAALQSNTNNPVTKNRNTWMTEIRKMESLNGTLGLEETQNSNLTPTTESGSNNLDIHMQKNTEYGAMAILSASVYGKNGKINKNETTTGNKTGVVIPYNNEWTAAQYTEWYGQSSYDNRYINYYTVTTDENKNGDAYLETKGWHSTTYVRVVNDSSSGVNPYKPVCYNHTGGIVRCLNTGIFAFNNQGTSWSYIGNDRNAEYNSTAEIGSPYTTRAVIVNGQGIN